LEHKLGDRLNPERLGDRYEKRQRRKAARDVRDTAQREVRTPRNPDLTEIKDMVRLFAPF
jgi:hypothetical protein